MPTNEKRLMAKIGVRRKARQKAALRVFYFAVHRPDYPRNRRIRDYLRGMPEVSSLQMHVKRRESCRIVRAIGNFSALVKGARGADIVFLAEFALHFAPIVRLVTWAFGARMVVDGYVGAHETEIDDHKKHSPRSLQAVRHRLVDLMARLLADAFLIDTEYRAEQIRARLRHKAKVFSLPVGAPAWAYPQDSPPRESFGEILFYGNFIPLQGVGVILEALSLIPRSFTFRATVVGSSIDQKKYVQLANALGVGTRCRFLDAVPEGQLAPLIASASIVLGIFGDSYKARTVIPNKVWQGLASGRTVVTRSGSSYGEIMPFVGGQLVQISPANPHELSETLVRLLEDVHRPVFYPQSAAALSRYVDQRFSDFGDWIRHPNSR